LALAYAGASLPLLILFTLSGQSLGTVANGEIVAVEIVATLVGSIGLVAAVPLSTWFAALVATEGHDAHGPPAPSSQSTRRRPSAAPRVSRKPRPRKPEPAVESILEPRDESEFWR
jgi:hypothetical protein